MLRRSPFAVRIFLISAREVGVLSIRDLLREEIQDMRDYIGQTEG